MDEEGVLCLICRTPITPPARRYRRAEGDIHVVCDQRERASRSPSDGAAPSASTASSDTRGETILVVDDIDDVRSLFAVILQRGGFEVVEARNGSEALALAAGRPDLIVLDVHLPDIDGFEVCRRLRSNVVTASIPVLHVSAAYRSAEHRVRGLEGGADGYLTLPAQPEEVLATVKALLRVRRAETELRAIQERYRRIVDAAVEGVWMVDAEARTTYVNRQMAAMLGCTVGEILGVSLYEFSDEADRAETRRGFERRTRGIAERLEARFRRRDGTELCALVSSTPMFDEIGHFVGVLGLVTDITDRKRAEEQVSRLASIVASSDDAIVGKTLDGTITSWNTGAERLYGYSSAEAIGQPIAIVVPEDRHDELQLIFERLRRGQRMDHFETVRRRKDRTSVEVSVSISPIYDRDGRIVGASAITRDISERKLVEEAVRETAALRSVATLATAAAHEINNPLAVIRGNLQLVSRHALDADARRRAEAAIQACDRIHEIIGRMQRITSLELVPQSPGLPDMLDLRRSSAALEASVEEPRPDDP